MKKINKDFPIFLVKNFYNPWFSKRKIINTIIYNKTFHDPNTAHNFAIIDDQGNKFFTSLYKKFYSLCKKKFVFTKSDRSIETCWSYLSDKNYFKEEWHNHLRTSTINAVYYLNIPNNDNVTIDFELNGNFLRHKVDNYDLLIFPDYLNHKPNRCYKDGYRISINMEIICNEPSNYIFNNMR